MSFGKTATNPGIDDIVWGTFSPIFGKRKAVTLLPVLDQLRTGVVFFITA